MSGILARTFWPTASTSSRSENNENMVQNTNDTVSFTGWGDDHSAPMDEDPNVTLSHTFDRRSWTPLTNPSGGSWVNDQGIAGESNPIQASSDVNEAPMEDKISQSRSSTIGEMSEIDNSGVLTAPGVKDTRELTREEVNEGMPGFLSVGEPPELSRTRSIEVADSSMSYSWQEDPLFTTPIKRNKHHEPETQVCFSIIPFTTDLTHYSSSLRPNFGSERLIDHLTSAHNYAHKRAEVVSDRKIYKQKSEN
jgi:hypothetical protein